MTNNAQIQICLNCPEAPAECIADNLGCKHLAEITSAKEIEKAKKQDEIASIQELLTQFDYSIPTKVIIEELGIGRNRIDLLKRRGLIQTTKIHNGRGGLRIVATNKACRLWAKG